MLVDLVGHVLDALAHFQRVFAPAHDDDVFGHVVLVAGSLPSGPRRPRRLAWPMTTVPTSLMRMGVPLTVATAMFSMSDTLLIKPSPRTT